MLPFLLAAALAAEGAAAPAPALDLRAPLAPALTLASAPPAVRAPGWLAREVAGDSLHTWLTKGVIAGGLLLSPYNAYGPGQRGNAVAGWACLGAGDAAVGLLAGRCPFAGAISRWSK